MNNTPIRYPVDFSIDETKLSEQSRKFYRDCLEYWEGGAVNVHAGIMLLARESIRRNDLKRSEPRLDLNRDPGARLVLSQINSLLKIDTIGGIGEDQDTFDLLKRVRQISSLITESERLGGVDE